MDSFKYIFVSQVTLRADGLPGVPFANRSSNTLPKGAFPYFYDIETTCPLNRTDPTKGRRVSSGMSSFHSPVVSKRPEFRNNIVSLGVAARLQATHITEIKKTDCPDCPLSTRGCEGDRNSTVLGVRSVYQDLGKLCYRP